MKRKRWTALLILAGLFLTQPMQAQDRDEQMINASLRFIKENANLTKKEYEKFARIYIEYNEQLAKLNRELKPESRDYMKRWQTINDDYMKKLDKALPDSTRQKVGMAQWELGQKVWGQWSEQNRNTTERQFQMMGQWNQMNPQFMMQPHMYWGQPDTAMIRRMEESRRRYRERDSLWMQRRQQFGPQSQFGPGFGPQPQFGPGFDPQSGFPQNGPQFSPGTSPQYPYPQNAPQFGPGTNNNSNRSR